MSLEQNTIKETLKKEIDEEIKKIENKLRTSFQLVKKDNEKILNSLSSLKECLSKKNILRDIKSLKDSLYKELKHLEGRIYDNEKKMNDITRKINKTDIKKDLEKQLFGIFNKKIEMNSKKQEDFLKRETQKILSAIDLTKKSFRGEIQENNEKIEVLKTFIEERILQEKENFEKDKQELIEDLKRKLNEIEEKRKKEILSLKSQISYLKKLINEKDNKA